MVTSSFQKWKTNSNSTYIYIYPFSKTLQLEKYIYIYICLLFSYLFFCFRVVKTKDVYMYIYFSSCNVFENGCISIYIYIYIYIMFCVVSRIVVKIPTKVVSCQRQVMMLSQRERKIDLLSKPVGIELKNYIKVNNIKCLGNNVVHRGYRAQENFMRISCFSLVNWVSNCNC